MVESQTRVPTVVKQVKMYLNTVTTPTVPGELCESISNAAKAGCCHVTADAWCFAPIPPLWDLFRQHATAAIVNPLLQQQ